MRAPLLPLLILLVICSVIDVYIYHQIKRHVTNSSLWRRIQLWSAIAFQLMLVVGIMLPARDGDNTMLLWKMWLLFTYATIYLPKILFVIFDLLAAIPRLFHARRFTPLTIIGALGAIILFAGMWWGALINRYRIDNRSVTIEIVDLPEEFDGYKIVQLSDLHLGTFVNDTTFLARIIADVHSQQPDIVVFTGDIVNRQSAEIHPFVKTLSHLHAPDGIFAILGNHDYGDYKDWPDFEAKEANMQELYDAYNETGIRLMRNETVWLRRGNDSIALIGVENIGDPPFPVYGSLTKAYPNLDDKNIKVLLSHNPAHWVDSIAENPDVNIPLTLAGHTHAMQIELGGISPAALRYPTWGGLYADSPCTRISQKSTDSQSHAKAGSTSVVSPGSHLLYVNIGAGTVGLPMRMGATPEVTILTLRRSPNSSK